MNSFVKILFLQGREAGKEKMTKTATQLHSMPILFILFLITIDPLSELMFQVYARIKYLYI